jgi:solute carrier family 25 aspartate/glutamate transporter 12/13
VRRKLTAAMATVTEKVKDTLLGIEQLPQVSEQNRAEFISHARKDEETGEYYMTEAEFIDAIAPPNEDYVQLSACVFTPIANHVFLHSTR